MACMRTVGNGHQRPAHASVRADDGGYVIALEVPDFTESELTVEALGRRLTVRGDQAELGEDEGKSFRLHERLEETFLLPEDAVVEQVRVFFRHGTLKIHAPRSPLTPRRLPIEHPSFRSNANAVPC